MAVKLSTGAVNHGARAADGMSLAIGRLQDEQLDRCGQCQEFDPLSMMLIRGLIAGLTVIGVTELSRRWPRGGALLLTLPLVSILAFVMAWTKDRDLPAVSRLARETLVLVPLGLPFFIPLAYAERLGLGFWPAFAAGVVLASITIGLWMWLGPDRA